MNRKTIVTSIIIAIALIAIGFYLVKYTLDPFGAPPKGTSPNCGPENRYKFDVTINSKEDFVNFLKTHEINQWVRLDTFKNISAGMTFDDINSLPVDWDSVSDAIKTENVGLKKMYVLNYNPYMCSGFTLKMTTDGYVSVYGCCGK